MDPNEWCAISNSLFKSEAVQTFSGVSSEFGLGSNRKWDCRMALALAFEEEIRGREVAPIEACIWEG